ncbi:hypothetical protein GLOIN_2v1558481 [Rhizophagus clarus]|nr:hypothetical protein GLOIN_2v1558481 [Rhizophagus clarus]
MNQVVKSWQDRAKSSIIESFMESCFPYLHEKKEAWNKIKDIVILSMFSHHTKLVRGSEVSEMVQYGFAQLCIFKHLADLNILQKDAITVQIAEPIPILASKEYIRKHPEEFETWLYRNLSSVHYNASCAGFLFEPCLTIPLAELFNAKSCKEHNLFTNIENIDKLNLLSYEATIRNFDDRNSSIFKAGPDLVCIVEFHIPNGIVKILLFLQAKLVKDSPNDTVSSTTDPHHFYSHGDKRTELKEKLRSEVLDCLESRYYKAHEFS